MRTIHLLDKNFCTGCGSCYNICPVETIIMRSTKWAYLKEEVV